LGNLLSTLLSENKPEGNYNIEFDAADLPSGVYFYKISAGEYLDVKKMILLR
jgi:hypothetical protein